MSFEKPDVKKENEEEARKNSLDEIKNLTQKDEKENEVSTEEQVELSPEMEKVLESIKEEEGYVGGILSKFPEKIKKSIGVGILSLTLFSGMGAWNAAEAGGRSRNSISYRVSRGIGAGLGRGSQRQFERAVDHIFRNILGIKSEAEIIREQNEARREWARQIREARREKHSKEITIRRLEEQALRDYSADLRKAKSPKEIQRAKDNLKSKMEEIKKLKDEWLAEK